MPIPIACVPCALTAEERARSRKLREELAEATEETIALDDGYAFRYRADAARGRATAYGAGASAPTRTAANGELRLKPAAITPAFTTAERARFALETL